MGYKYFTVNDLKDLSIEKIKLLSSDSLISGYKNKYFTVNDFKDLSIDEIKIYTSKETMNNYKSLKFEDFKASLEKMKIADNHKVEISKNPEVSSFNDLVVNDHNHEENVDIIGKDL